MRKILGILALCLLLTSCECLHDGGTRQRVYEDDVCTCIESKTYTDHSTTYFFVGEKVPVKIDVNIVPNKEAVKPQIGSQYKIRFSYWRCTGCQKAGIYKIQDGMIIEEVNDKN